MPRKQIVGTLSTTTAPIGHNMPPADVDYTAGIAKAVLSADQADGKLRTVAQTLAYHLQLLMQDKEHGAIEFRPEAFLSSSATEHRNAVLKAIDARVKDLRPNVRGWYHDDASFIASAKSRVHRSMTLLASVLVVGGALTDKGARIDPSRLLPVSDDKVTIGGWHMAVRARIDKADDGFLPLDGSTLDVDAMKGGKPHKVNVKLTNDAIAKLAAVMCGRVAKTRGTKATSETPKAETFESVNDTFRRFTETARNANGGAPINDNVMVLEIACSVIVALEALGLASYVGENPVLTLQGKNVETLTDLAERLDMLSKLDLIAH